MFVAVNASESRLSIGLLADHPEALGELERWFVREWEPYYGPKGPGDARRDLAERLQRDRIPLALVAHWDGVLCGTAGLCPVSITTHRHLTPWLAALVVAPEHRGRGIGGRLVRAVEERARDLGFRSLYVGTSAQDPGARRGGDPHFYLSRGWELLETTPYFTGRVSILRRGL